MQGVAQPKRNVSIDVTRHIRTFIDPNNGEEITREQLKALSRGIKLETEVREPIENTEEGGGVQVEEEGK